MVIVSLFFVGLIAGFVDSIAGGGGLITVPSLLFAGIDPLVALGTNRMQSAMGELSATVNYARNKQLDLKHLPLGILFTVIGSCTGSYAVSIISKDSLEFLIPILMVCMTIYSIFSKRLRSKSNGEAKVSPTIFYIGCGLVIGFYNGFFGPGVGSIWIIAFVILLGFTVKFASINTKPLNLVGNLASLAFFFSIGAVNIGVGVAMGLGQICGAFAGSHIVMNKGDAIVRPMFIAVTSFMTLKLLIRAIN
jgi:uncharacterized protein